MWLEFYLSKNEHLNYKGEVIKTEFKLNCFDDDNCNLSFSSMDELLNIPFRQPDKFLEFVKTRWNEKEINTLINDGEYVVDGETFYLNKEKSNEL